MSNLHLILCVLFCCLLTGSAYEVRVWEDLNGNRYEGRFVKELFGKLTIEGEDGSTKKFELEGLSELDQKYLRVRVPPEMEMDVRSKNRSIEPPPMTLFAKEYMIDEYQVTASITKKSQRPFTSRLKAELFLIAEEVEGPNYILLGRTEREFLMPTISKGSEVELKSGRVRTKKFRDPMSSAMKGEEYVGYLVVISSLEDEILLIDSNLPSWFENPEIIKNQRELAIRGAPSPRSRHFDKTGKKVPPPRPDQRPPRST